MFRSYQTFLHSRAPKKFPVSHVGIAWAAPEEAAFVAPYLVAVACVKVLPCIVAGIHLYHPSVPMPAC
jgi:hypothetical protein